MNTTIPGDLTSEKAGPILRRGAPVRGPKSRTGVVDIVTHHPNGTHCMTVLEGLVDLAALTLDVADPAGMDLAARWLARHHGHPIGPTAPSWGRYVCGEHCADGETGRMAKCSRPIWSLLGADGMDPVTFAECGTEAPDDREIVPSISALTDPAEALALACLAAGGR